MDRFIAIDTSSAPASIALFEHATLVSYHEGSAENAQGESILVLLSVALKQAGWPKQSVKTWVVGRGPGSFTGIRVTLSTVQGIVMAGLGEVFGVTSFEALRASFVRANPEHQTTCLVCALPALPGEAYLSLPTAEPSVCELTALPQLCAPWRPCLILGGAASLCSGSDDVHFPGQFERPNAAGVGYAYLDGVRGPCTPLYVAPPKITQPRQKPAHSLR